MIRNAIQRFMYGRYGNDPLNLFLMALYLLGKMTSDGRARLRHPSKPFLNEFLLETDYSVDSLIAAAIRKGGILPGIKIDDHTILMAATEMQTREDVDCLVEIYKSVCEN